MIGISSISANLLKCYVNFNANSAWNDKDMLAKVSKEKGGDGTTLTKDQLDKYLLDASNEIVDSTKDELKALTELQKNWDAIAGKGTESITLSEAESSTRLKLETPAVDVSDKKDFANEVDNYLAKSVLEGSSEDYVSKSELESLLGSLLTGTPSKTDEDDDDNSELVAMITNMIATQSTPSIVSVEA